MKSLKQYIRESLAESGNIGANSTAGFRGGIKDMEDVRKFFIYLCKDRKLCFHPDEPFDTYVDCDGGPAFNAEECRRFDELMDQCFYVCDTSHKDIYEFADGIMRSWGIKESRGDAYDDYFKESFTVGEKACKYDEIYHATDKRGRHNFARPEKRRNGKKWNLICTEWFDATENFGDEGFALVRKNGKYNFVNTDGYIISDEYNYTAGTDAGWFDEADSFIEGAAIVKKDERWNFINETGNIASDDWFDGVELYKGLMLVRQGGEFNLYDQYDEYPEPLSDEWFTDFDQVDDFIDNADK